MSGERGVATERAGADAQTGCDESKPDSRPGAGVGQMRRTVALLAAAGLLGAAALPGAQLVPDGELERGGRRLLAEAAGPHHFERCAGVVDHLRISELSFDPDPVRPDATLRVRVAGKLDEPVEGGSAKLTISYYGVPVAMIAFDICAQFGISCPQKAGTPFHGLIAYPVPDIPLSGVTLDVQIDVVDAKGRPISCIKTQAKVVAG